MLFPRLTRRASLLLPFLLAACGGGDTKVYAPFSYEYLPPIRLNVATVEFEQRFYPSGIAPDTSANAPVPPVAALRQLGVDRLKAFGNSNHAVFSITDASLLKHGDEIDGSMAVTLAILSDDAKQLGYVEARVSRQHTGHIDSLRGTLYDLTSGLLDDMNVELEYQIRQHLRDWLTTDTAEPTPVSATPLDQPHR